MSSLLDWLVQNESQFRRTRLPSLYSDLAVQKTTNPEGYAANVTAWEAALTRAAVGGRLGPRLVLETSDDLLDALASPQYGRPSGLGCVVDEAVRHGKMIDMTDFLTSPTPIYNRSWIPSPWAVLKWSLRQVGLSSTHTYDAGGRLKKGRLVVVSALEEVEKAIQKVVQSKNTLTDRITSRELFVQEVGRLVGGLSDQDVEVLLRYLSRDKQVLSYDETTIKFRPSTGLPEPVTQDDRSIASLKTLMSSLTAQTENLATRVVTLQAAAQTAVKAGNKTSALSALRSKKLAEQTLKSRADTLHQLEEVYAKIEVAADHVEVVAAMESSAAVLKSLHHKIGGVDRVEDVVETLRDEMGKVDEVTGVISEPLPSAVLDEGEVDDELEQMEREERARKEAAETRERQKVEAQEAEVTRRKLAELDELQAHRQPEPPRPAATPAQHVNDGDAEFEHALSSSVDKMQTLDLDGRQEDRDRDPDRKPDQDRRKVVEGPVS